MATLQALYLQDPLWIWLALACLFVALDLATGSSALAWPALAAAGVAVLELAGLRLGPVGEAAIFAVLSLAAIGGAHLAGRGMAAPAGPSRATPPAMADSSRQERTARLVGRIGRASSDFVNGVGRVWLDGAEWGAEIHSGEEELPKGAPVRVVAVIGGVRLQVHALDAG